jgi:hypothetical protein
MKKLISMMAALMVVASAFVVGCDISDSQQKVIAQTAGMVAAATWRGIDNPSADEIASMKAVVAKIQEACCTNCTADTSYYARVYPLADEYITKNVKPVDQPMCRLGAAFILTSMDTAFAANPTWKKDADKTTAIIGAFCDGVQAGLGLPTTDPVVQAATRQTSVRVKMKVAK